MIQATIRFLALIAIAALVASLFAAVIGIPFWLGLVILLALVGLEARLHREPDPPEPLEQTGGFPRSRR